MPSSIYSKLFKIGYIHTWEILRGNFWRKKIRYRIKSKQDKPDGDQCDQIARNLEIWEKQDYLIKNLIVIPFCQIINIYVNKNILGD
jgi:hypothetical protein